MKMRTLLALLLFCIPIMASDAVSATQLKPSTPARIPMKDFIRLFLCDIETSELLLVWVADSHKTEQYEKRLIAIQEQLGLKPLNRDDVSEVALLVSDMFDELEKKEEVGQENIPDYDLLKAQLKSQLSSFQTIILKSESAVNHSQIEASELESDRIAADSEKKAEDIKMMNQQSRLEGLRVAIATKKNEVEKATYEGTERKKRGWWIFEWMSKDDEVVISRSPPKEVQEAYEGVVREHVECQNLITGSKEAISRLESKIEDIKTKQTSLAIDVRTKQQETERLQIELNKAQEERLALIQRMEKYYSALGPAFYDSQVRSLWVEDADERLELLERLLYSLEVKAKLLKIHGVKITVVKS